MDAVIYIRWSSAEQGKGSSLERQQQDCRSHAARRGWTVLREIVDQGVSAFKGRHAEVGELARFVAEVESGAYPDGVVLLTEKLDRLSREEAKKVFTWLMRVTEMKVVVATVEGDRCYDDRNFDMQTIIEVVVKAQLANEESEKKATRLAAAWTAKRARLARGDLTPITRRAPAWLGVEGTPPQFVVLDERAEIVRRVFRDTVAGFGKHHIARHLNLEGVPCFGRAKGWHASYVQKILCSPAVLGEFQPGSKPRGERRRAVGDVMPDYYPRIVDADLHATAMRSMAGRSRRTIGRGRRLANLFSGLATCSSCGSRMTFRAKGLRPRADGSSVQEDYLVCDGYQRGRGCKMGEHFPYAVWEAGILDAVLADAMNDRHFSSPDVVRALEVELAERSRACAAAKARAEIALALFVETGRPEVKAKWVVQVEEADGHGASIADLQRRVVEARGAVSPEEHRRRIATLRGTLDDADERIRFETRSRIMEAVHELVATMTFSAAPLEIEMRTNDGVIIQVVWDWWSRTLGDARPSHVKSMNDGSYEFPARYEIGSPYDPEN